MLFLWLVNRLIYWPQVAGLAAQTDPIQVLLNYGLAGVVVFLVITGQLRTKAEVHAKDAIIAKQAEIISAFQQSLTSNALPAMSAGIRAVEAVPHSESRTLDQVADAQRDMAVLVGRLEALVADATGEGGNSGP